MVWYGDFWCISTNDVYYMASIEHSAVFISLSIFCAFANCSYERARRVCIKTVLSRPFDVARLAAQHKTNHSNNMQICTSLCVVVRLMPNEIYGESYGCARHVVMCPLCCHLTHISRDENGFVR